MPKEDLLVKITFHHESFSLFTGRNDHFYIFSFAPRRCEILRWPLLTPVGLCEEQTVMIQRSDLFQASLLDPQSMRVGPLYLSI